MAILRLTGRPSLHRSHYIISILLKNAVDLRAPSAKARPKGRIPERIGRWLLACRGLPRDKADIHSQPHHRRQ